jgi:hypothetical protein
MEQRMAKLSFFAPEERADFIEARIAENEARIEILEAQNQQDRIAIRALKILNEQTAIDIKLVEERLACAHMTNDMN